MPGVRGVHWEDNNLKKGHMDEYIKQQIHLVHINGLPAGVTCDLDLFAIADDSVLQREIPSVEDCNISNGI